MSSNDRKLSIKSPSEEDDEIETSCGIGHWRPAWLQPWNSPFLFMLNLALVGVIQGMIGAIFYSSIGTFEKRYGFDSKISGVILIADNIAALMLNQIVGYFGVRFNRSRLIAIGEVILSVACFLTAAPYFIYGHVEHHDKSSSSNSLLSSSNQSTLKFEMCLQENESRFDCADSTRRAGVTAWPAVYCLVAGSFAYGIGYTCYYVVGVPYLDDNIRKDKSPVYISIFHSIRLIGPTLGFVLASFCLKYYENPFVDPGFGTTDPRFVGAWWLSFCITGGLLFLFSLPMFCFPTQFKNAPVDTVEMIKKTSIEPAAGSIGAFKRKIRNPLVMFGMFGTIFRLNGMGGFVMFKSKYIESQYKQSASSASLLTGFSSFAPMSIGIMAGGLMLAYLKPKPRTVFIIVFAVECVTIFTIGSGLFLGCDPIKLVGGFGGEDGDGFSLQANCNSNCACSTRVYSPICAPDSSTTYFSPCYAGCSVFNSTNQEFSNCTCFTGEARNGFCPADLLKCNNLYKFMVVLTIGNIVSAFARVPNWLISMRSVDPMDKGFAIGFGSSMLAVFAFMQYPLIFGWITDSACLIWEKKCGKTGNCWFYDNQRFRTYLIGGAVGFVALGSGFDLIMIWYSDQVQEFYDDNDKKVEEEAEENRNGNMLEMN